MTWILLISTVALDLLGLLFAGAYVWLNAFTREVSDLAGRNTGLLKTIRLSVILSLAFSLLSCLLGEGGNMDAAIARTAGLYGFIALSWLAVVACCGVAILMALTSKKSYRPTANAALEKLLTTALWGAIPGLVLMWLFS